MKTTPSIVAYRKCICHQLDGKWGWQCPVWFNSYSIFADAYIKGTTYFESQRAAVANMMETMVKFGITKRTTVL